MDKKILNTVRIIFFLVMIVIVLDGYVRLVKLQANINKVMGSLANSAANFEDISSRINKYVNEDRLKNVENLINTQALSTQITTNEYTRIATAATDTLRKEVMPAIAQFRETTRQVGQQVEWELAQTMPEFRFLLAEMKNQIESNGNQSQELLIALRGAIVKNNEELQAVLKEIASATKSVRLIAENEDIARLLEESANTMRNIEVVSFNASQFSKRLNPSPSKGFFNKLGKGALKVIKIAGGLGYSAYLVQQIQ